MTKLEMRQGRGIPDRPLDRKAVFDAGYVSYEDGRSECDFGPESETWAVDPSFAAMWRFGWQRAQEDSQVPRGSLRFD